MPSTLPSQQSCKAWRFILYLSLGLLPTLSFAKVITPVNLLENFKSGEPWDRGVLSATKSYGQMWCMALGGLPV